MTTVAGLAEIGRDPDALEAFYREHLEAVQRFVSRCDGSRTLGGSRPRSGSTASPRTSPTCPGTRSAPPGTVRDGETFVMAVSGEPLPPSGEESGAGGTDLGGFSGWTEFDVTAGPVKPCTVVPGDSY